MEMMMKKICTHQSIVQWRFFAWAFFPLYILAQFAVTVMILNSNFPWKRVPWSMFCLYECICYSSSCNRPNDLVEYSVLNSQCQFYTTSTRGTLFWISIHNIIPISNQIPPNPLLYTLSIIRLLAVITCIRT